MKRLDDKIRSNQSQPSSGLAFRSNLAATGTSPAPVPYCLSPDIIGSATAIPDPQAALTTTASIAEMYDSEPASTGDTCYYVRAIATNGAERPGKATLLAGPAQLIPFPSLWGSPLSTASGGKLVNLAAGANGFVASTEPFIYGSSPIGGAITFVAVAGAAGIPSAPAVSDFTDMANVLATELEYGFNSVAYVDADSQSWTVSVSLAIPETLSAGGTLTLALTSQGYVGATVGLVAAGFSSSRAPILIDPIALQPSELTSVTVDVEPGFAAEIAIQFWAGSGTVQPGSSVTLSASIPVSSDELADAIVRGGFSPGCGQVGVGPTLMMLLGDFTIMAIATEANRLVKDVEAQNAL